MAETPKKPRWVSEGRWQRELRHWKGRSCLKQCERESSQYLYERLNIIDAKSSALLTFNSIAIAAVGLIANVWKPEGLEIVVLTIAFFPWLASTWLCLMIIGLRWPRLKPTNWDVGFADYCNEFVEETAKRTGMYRIAQKSIMAAFLIVVVGWTGLALVTNLDEEPEAAPSETALLSEAALAEDWNRPEEEEAWSHLVANRIISPLHRNIAPPRRARMVAYSALGRVLVAKHGPTGTSPARGKEFRAI